MSQYFNKILIYGRQHRHRHLISPTRHGCTHGTLGNAIFTSLIGYEIDVIHTLRFNNDADFLYRLATALGMRPNHEYWCKCAWRTNGMNKTATSDRRPPLTVGLPVTSARYLASFQVTRLFHNVTVPQCDHFFAATYVFVWNFTRLITRLKRIFFNPRFGGGALSSNVFTICAVYWSLGRRRYFGVSNVALVFQWWYLHFWRRH